MGAHPVVMAGRMVLCVVVAEVVDAWVPVDEELAEADAILNPVEAHVNGLAALLLDRVVDDARSCAVICLDGGSRLHVAQFFQGDAEGTRVTTVVEQGCQFGLGCACHNFFENLPKHEDGAIEWWGWIVGSCLVAHIMVSASCGARLGLGQI